MRWVIVADLSLMRSGISDQTAIRYAESAKQILTTLIEDTARRAQGSTPLETAPPPVGSRLKTRQFA